jgi:diguanylate cyclase (GGDEF)-like protein
MVDEGKLSVVLSDFARTLITDFPIQGILDSLVERITDVLPIASAGVTLISETMQPRIVAASGDEALRWEHLQSDLAEGPCLEAYSSGEPLLIPDLLTETRFPRFVPAALDAGLGAVFTFPLRHGSSRLGALDLYACSPGPLDERDITAAQTLADVAAAYVLNAQARDDAQAASDQFQHNALHDPLTGLPNRLLLQERLEHAARRAQRSHTNAALLYADINRFKLINDTYGHQAGDELLVAVANRLSSIVRSGDTLARIGGDEFIFLCEDLRSPADVDILMQRINEMFEQPFNIATIEVSITANVGKAFAGPGEDISGRLLVQSDMSMYQVKRQGGSSPPTVDLRAPHFSGEDLRLESRLRVALDDGQLDVAYQPIVRSADRAIIGVEALLRWFDPDRGPVSPMIMIRVAEQTTLINEIGAWILERSCRDHARWSAESPSEPLDLAVNVSVRQLMQPGFTDMVGDVLARTRMSPTALILEVTESIFIDDSGVAISVLNDLNARGVRLALDDFGTGYSSLSYLSRLPIQIVKIDRGFIGKVGTASRERVIAAAVTSLAHQLGLTVIAEGVELQSEHDAINAIGCEYAQGYFYGRPLPARGIGEQLAAAAAKVQQRRGRRPVDTAVSAVAV